MMLGVGVGGVEVPVPGKTTVELDPPVGRCGPSACHAKLPAEQAAPKNGPR